MLTPGPSLSESPRWCRKFTTAVKFDISALEKTPSFKTRTGKTLNLGAMVHLLNLFKVNLLGTYRCLLQHMSGILWSWMCKQVKNGIKCSNYSVLPFFAFKIYMTPYLHLLRVSCFHATETYSCAGIARGCRVILFSTQAQPTFWPKPGPLTQPKPRIWSKNLTTSGQTIQQIRVTCVFQKHVAPHIGTKVHKRRLEEYK